MWDFEKPNGKRLTEKERLKFSEMVDLVSRGVKRGNEGDLDGAIADFTQAIRINPSCGIAYANRGFMLFK